MMNPGFTLDIYILYSIELSCMKTRPKTHIYHLYNYEAIVCVCVCVWGGGGGGGVLSCADPEGGGGGMENHKLYGFL